MTPEYFAMLYDYTAWANRRVWACVMQLPEEKYFEELDYSIGSIFIQCLHTAAVEMWWLSFLATGEVQFVEDADAYKDRAALRLKWDEIEAANRAYIAHLTPQELEREVRPPFWEADKQPIKVWQALLQVAHHSTDHRAQTLAGLHQLGAPTVGQDVLDYLFERQTVR